MDFQVTVTVHLVGVERRGIDVDLDGVSEGVRFDSTPFCYAPAGLLVAALGFFLIAPPVPRDRPAGTD